MPRLAAAQSPRRGAHRSLDGKFYAGVGNAGRGAADNVGLVSPSALPRPLRYACDTHEVRARARSGGRRLAYTSVFPQVRATFRGTGRHGPGDWPNSLDTWRFAK